MAGFLVANHGARRALLFATAIVGVLGLGAALWSGLHWMVAYTNSNAYCTSCHAMQVVTAEYQASRHFVNPSGIVATCSDCHVPRSFGAALWHKAGSFREVIGALLGTIDTPEQFEQHRLALAQIAKADIEASGSEGCRTCHAVEAMSATGQSPMARVAHAEAVPKVSCVDCHRGLVHTLPVALGGEDTSVTAKEPSKSSGSLPHQAAAAPNTCVDCHLSAGRLITETRARTGPAGPATSPMSEGEG